MVGYTTVQYSSPKADRELPHVKAIRLVKTLVIVAILDFTCHK